MKKLFLLVVCVAIATTTLVAQPRSEADKAEAKARMEQLLQTRLEMLKNELQLTDTQYAAFEPVYRDYRKALDRVVDRKAMRVKKEEINNENALKVVAARLSNTAVSTAVKQRYLVAFTEVIEPIQIERLYRIDDRIAREARKVAQYSKK
jgi:hypothetical protein